MNIEHLIHFAIRKNKRIFLNKIRIIAFLSSGIYQRIKKRRRRRCDPHKLNQFSQNLTVIYTFKFCVTYTNKIEVDAINLSNERKLFLSLFLPQVVQKLFKKLLVVSLVIPHTLKPDPLVVNFSKINFGIFWESKPSYH